MMKTGAAGAYHWLRAAHRADDDITQFAVGGVRRGEPGIFNFCFGLQLVGPMGAELLDRVVGQMMKIGAADARHRLCVAHCVDDDVTHSASPEGLPNDENWRCRCTPSATCGALC